MEYKTPERLFVCLCKYTPAHTQGLAKIFAEGSSLSAEAEALRDEHLRYTYDLGERGITWAGGPFADFSGSLSIYAVNSLEEAKKARQDDPYYLKGIFYDDEYFEWTIHMPIGKASPRHRERLIQDLARLGIMPG